MKEKVILLQCGSFNPVTIMHLRMMEIAKDHLHQCGYSVIGGFFSPVHDAYPKDSLISITHRSNMLKQSLESSDWLQLSTWESEQNDWTATYNVLRHHQENISNLMESMKNMNRLSGSNKIDMNANLREQITVKLIGGGDFIASFNVPGLWNPFHMEEILKKHGLVIITRCGYNIAEIIDNNEILFKYMNRIIVVNEYMENHISSTRIRKACSRGLSIKYLVCDGVERYIKEHKLYSNNMIKYEKDKTETNVTKMNNEFNKSTSTKIKSVTSSKTKRQNRLSIKKKSTEGVRTSSRLKKYVKKKSK